jgi:hypothetical protein
MAMSWMWTASEPERGGHVVRVWEFMGGSVPLDPIEQLIFLFVMQFVLR